MPDLASAMNQSAPQCPTQGTPFWVTGPGLVWLIMIYHQKKSDGALSCRNKKKKNFDWQTKEGEIMGEREEVVSE